jgi:hypothetical protein
VTAPDNRGPVRRWNEMMPQFTDLVTIDEHGCVEDDYTAHLEHSERFWTTHPPTAHPGRARRKRRGEGRVGTPALAGTCHPAYPGGEAVKALLHGSAAGPEAFRSFAAC